MKKKIGVVILATMMAGLVACGSDDKTGSNETTTIVANNETQNETQKETQENNTEETSTEKPVVKGNYVTVVEEGCSYVVKASGTTLNPGEEIPAVPGNGDKYVTLDYTYTYGVKMQHDKVEAWNVQVNDKSKESYGKIIDGIGEMAVTHMYRTFWQCKNLVSSPEIPAGITTMNQTYILCGKMVQPPVLPESLVDMYEVFSQCEKLETAPVIPAGVTRMYNVFWECKSLVQPSVLPEGVTDIEGLFLGCEKLETAPVIPEGVTNMKQTFKNCTSLKQAPVVPASVTTLWYTFSNCTSLTGTITINANVERYDGCLEKIDLEKQNITLVGESTQLKSIMETAN